MVARTARASPPQGTFSPASSRGAVSALWQSCGHDPRGLDALHALYRTLMDDPAPLTRAQAELIAVVVSATNGCGYTLAACRAFDSSCDVSAPRVQTLFDSVKAGRIRSAARIRERPSASP